MKIKSVEIFRHDLPVKNGPYTMANAEVGDEQAGEDPTVNKLCEMAAELTGHEAAVYLPSGTMCNAIAYRLYCRQGDGVILDELGGHRARVKDNSWNTFGLQLNGHVCS